jgi:3-phenylpropionate/trans-cinnamate dioxygenase ferredoxin subunit
MSAMARYVVARATDIPEGERKIVEAGGRQIGIFHLDGEFHALLHRCPHLGGPLCLGPIVGIIESDGPGDLRFDPDRKFLTCPWHGWEFDLRTGQSYLDPQRMRARRVPVAVEAGEAIAHAGDAGHQPGPYVAEVIPIAVEEDYLVLTMRS